MTDRPEPPICQFYRLVPDAPQPRRADASADGMIPTRGYRYCAVSSLASAFGWYLFPPIDFSLVWTGNTIAWTYGGAPDWYPLRAAQYPGLRDHFSRHAPPAARPLAPTFLAASRDLAMVQIWSGFLARTAPGWGLLSRSPVNIPRSQDYEQYEGIFQTEAWFGPIFTNIRLTQKNTPIEFHRRYPLLQAQPVRHECYLEPAFEVREFADLTDADWSAFSATMAPNSDPMRKLGHHAVEVRRRLRGERPAAGEPARCPRHAANDGSRPPPSAAAERKKLGPHLNS